MASTPYNAAAALFQNFKSLTCFHTSPSSFTAESHDFFSLSSETPKTVKFLSLNCLYVATTFGFSSLHGPHQLAQKSSNTYFPRSELKVKGFPSISVKVKS